MKKNKKIAKTVSKSNSGPPEMDFSYFSPIEVKVFNFEKALKTFRALVQSEKVLSLYKEKQSYEKPSDKKRRKHNEMIQNMMENEVKQKKIISGEYEKEKIKKQAEKDRRRKEKEDNKND